jgi:hypothetical protein
MSWIVDIPDYYWTNQYTQAFSWVYTALDTWYLGTSWSGLEASYNFPTFIVQSTTGTFDFPDPYSVNDTNLYPSKTLYFGD